MQLPGFGVHRQAADEQRANLLSTQHKQHTCAEYWLAAAES